MKLFSVTGASNLLNVKVSTLYAWVHYRKIAYTKTGGKLGFLESELTKFIESNTHRPE